MLTKIFLYFRIESISYPTLDWMGTGILTAYLPRPEKSNRMIT
jgi:hypothetical protein